MARKPHNKKDVDRLIDEGTAALDEGDSQEAIRCFREALKIAPLRNDLRQLLAMALEQQVVPEKKAAPKRRRVTRDDEDEIVEEKPHKASHPRKKRTFVTCLFWLTFFSLLAALLIMLFVIFREPIKEWVTSKLPDKMQPVSQEEKEAMALYESAETFYRQHRYDQAIEAIEKARSALPDIGERADSLLGKIYSAKGVEHYDREHYLSAALAYEKAVEHDASVVDYHYDTGWAYYRYGLKRSLEGKPSKEYFTKARAAFEKTLELDPEYLRAYQGMARVYIRENRPDRAAKMYQKIIEIAPESYEAELAERQLKNMFGKSTR
jgi:tetratricopeptide (TPR) repeat protein